MKKVIIITLCSILFGSGAYQPAIAAETLELAPQDEGPTMEKTLSWLKQKIDAIRGAHEDSIQDSNIRSTTFDYDNKKLYFDQSIYDSRYFRSTSTCEMQALESGGASGNSVVISFKPGKCKETSGNTSENKTYCQNSQDGPGCYNNHYKSKDTVVMKCTSDESAEKIGKAFAHLAKLVKNMPKIRSKDSNDLF